MFILFQLFTRRWHHTQLWRMAVGFAYTALGLILFLCGVNVGFSPVGSLLGSQLAASGWRWLLVARRYPGKYCLSVFLQYLFVGVVIFYITLPVLPWWAQGPVMAVCLSLPALLRPAARGTHAWYIVVLNAIVVGFVVSFIKTHLPGIAHFFSAAA